MTLFTKQKMAVLGGVMVFASVAVGGYYFDVQGMMPKRSALQLPQIQLETIEATNPRLPTLLGDLFGPLPESAKTLTETNLNLILKGTVPAFNGDQGMAIIMVGAKQEQIIHVGDEVLRGVTLGAVHGKYVVLNRSDAKEVLRFPNSDDADKLLQHYSDVTPDEIPDLEEEEGESIGLTVSD